jgi:kynurenine formamidase
VNHNGTHVDVPVHFHPGATTLSDLPADTWLFTRPALVSVHVTDDTIIDDVLLEAALKDVDRDIDALLIRTGFGACRQTDSVRYCAANPGFSESAADYLRREFPELRGVFCDIPSFSAAKRTQVSLGSSAASCRSRRRTGDRDRGCLTR